MPVAAVSARPGDSSWPALPRPWVNLLMTTELRGAARDIVSQIRTEIPEYRRSLDGPVARATRQAVERALHSFFRQLCERGEAGEEHADVFRDLGRSEAEAGRSLECLHAAYRIGALTAWRRITALNERMPLPPDTVAQLASAVFGYVDRLAVLSAQGHQQALLGRTEHVDRLKARLLQMLLDQPATPMDSIRQLAEQIGWDLPEQVFVIDVRDGQLLPASTTRDLVGPTVLYGTELPPPTVLVAAPVAQCALARLRETAGKARLSIGPPVPLEQAQQSLRWAQLAARLREDGVLPDEPVLECEALMPTLLIAANPVVADLLVARRLGPLMALSPQKRWKFGRLLSLWLERGGSQADVAEALGLHRQTAHYQFTRLQEMFGDALRDPDARVEMLLALRSVLASWERTALEV